MMGASIRLSLTHMLPRLLFAKDYLYINNDG